MLKDIRKILLTGVFGLIFIFLLLPTSVHADGISDEFKKILNEDDKLVMNSIKPESKEEFGAFFEMLYWDFINNRFSSKIVNDDMTLCEITLYDEDYEVQETHTIEVIYNYDEKISKKLNGFVNSFPKNIEYFRVTDLELINFWLNTKDYDNLDSYSSELKKHLNYNNIEFAVDNRAGTDNDFYLYRLGIGTFKYDGILYNTADIGTKTENIIYVPSNTKNTDEELMKAAQKRIDDYLGKKDQAVVKKGSSITEWIEKFLKNEYETEKEWNSELQNVTFEEWKNSSHNYYSKDLEFLNQSSSDNYFIVQIYDQQYKIAIVRDSSKMLKLDHKTTDTKTNIEISSDVSIPYDTSVEVSKLTDGVEYEKIIKILEVENHETFDLKLYSKTSKEYITSLENGKFEVKIPIPENLKDKTLVVYYISEDENIEEYEVIIDNNYAIFQTDHFSIYTLAEKNITDSEQDTTLDNNQDTTVDNQEEQEKIPETFDKLENYIIIMFISLLGLSITLFLKKQINI
ncbi:MAG: hypothetical protein IJ501_00850 [Bacilli bacterium]|nr:hypothetical protein [Bacilli bacterium]